MENRKSEHIKLTNESQLAGSSRDERFYYEPALGFHQKQVSLESNFLGKKIAAPIWISSMTGGSGASGAINKFLAELAAHFQLGMGLGSIRPLLENDGKKYFEQFYLRPIIGPSCPLLANLGIGQLEKLLFDQQLNKLNDILGRLEVDGLMVHINPLQEWYQPEGDRFCQSPIETISQLSQNIHLPVFVKEVGQGIGPESLRELLKLPIAGLEFGGFGGTNFSKLESLRGSDKEKDFIYVGHTSDEMVDFLLQIAQENPELLEQKKFIISGGIRSILDGHYLINKLGYDSIIGQASSFLHLSQGSKETAISSVENKIEALKLAKIYLRIKRG